MKLFFPSTIWKSGSWLVVLIVLLGAVAAGLTFWNYSKHVYSSREAQVLNRNGAIGVFYPQHLAKKIQPHQVARVTFEEQTFMLPCKAEVVSVLPTMLGRRRVLLVTLQLLEPDNVQETATWKNDEVLTPGLGCSVTIDTTIPSTR